MVLVFLFTGFKLQNPNCSLRIHQLALLSWGDRKKPHLHVSFIFLSHLLNEIPGKYSSKLLSTEENGKKAH